jgi:hypothetical protein
MTNLKVSLLFAVVAFQVNAQTDSSMLKLKYEKEAIYFSGTRFVKGNVLYKIKHLKNEFDFSTEGMKTYALYQSDYRKGWKFATLGLVSYVSGLLIGINTNKNVGGALVLGSLIPSGLAIHFGLRANKRMKKAVWLRNRDLLLN